MVRQEAAIRLRLDDLKKVLTSIVELIDYWGLVFN